MTARKPSATAAQLRERFLVRCAQDQEIHDDSRVEFAGALDDLMAAVRAEALATRQSEIDELVADFQRLHAKYKRKPPLPRAVRELLRDVVLMDRERQATLTPFSEFVPMSVSQRAARILGTTPAAIVAHARKVPR